MTASSVCGFTVLAVVMRSGHLYLMMSAIMMALTHGANEGDLQFSIPRINARPGKGRGTCTSPRCQSMRALHVAAVARVA